MGLTTHNIISIVQIIFFIPFLAIAIFLCIRHGFGHNAGWILLIIFSLARLIGASLQLATIAQPKNISLYIGVLTLQSIGLSNFIILMFAMLNRALESIEKARSTVLYPRILQYVQLLVLISLILGAVGSSTTSYGETGVYKVSTLSQAGVGLTIAEFGLLVLATVVVGLNVSYAEPGEKRIVLAVALSLPFLFVRVLYSAIGTFQPGSAFSVLTGNIYIFLGTVVIEEIIIVLIIEAMGLTLQVSPKTDTPSSSGLFKRLGGGLFNHVERRFDGGYEPRRPHRAGGRRERRHDRRYDGYEMQGSHRHNESVRSV
ncbi:hypothetical protein F4782DRAFT_501720 [Xylaria castorea]|nr:hypothetical protein F4782DRAFT_501720 [Xylaria castorea]